MGLQIYSIGIKLAKFAHRLFKNTYSNYWRRYHRTKYGSFFIQAEHRFFSHRAKPKSRGQHTLQKIDGFLIENGPNTVLINNPSIQQLIEDCQLQKALLYPSEEAKKNRYVLRNGKLQLLPKSPLEVVSTPILKWNEKMALLKDIFTPKHKYDVSVSAFVNKRFGKAALKHFLFPS